MPPGPGLKEWFIPGEGIDRMVIRSDIQRYLGNDATVRPGMGTQENQGVPGYWVKAYRNLTTPMVEDLRASSRRWEQEQARSGHRVDHYQASHSFTVAGSGMPAPRAGDSPLGPMDPRDTRFGPQPTRGNRPSERMATDDRMVIEPTYNQPPPGRYSAERGDRFVDDRFNQPGSGMPSHMENDPRAFRDPQRDMRQPQDRFPQDMPGYGRDLRDPRDDRFAPRPDMRDPRAPNYGQMSGPPQGYDRQPEHYNSAMPNPSYGGPPQMHPGPRDTREPPFNQPQFGASPGQPRNDGRDPRFPSTASGFPPQDLRDPRDPRYAYPSPAQTIVDPRDNPQISSQHNTFQQGGPPQGGPGLQYDQQFSGRPPPPPPPPSTANAFNGQSGLRPGPPLMPPGMMQTQQPRQNPGATARRPAASDMDGDAREAHRRRVQ